MAPRSFPIVTILSQNGLLYSDHRVGVLRLFALGN